jgi:acyl-CoA synthetase (AMP-forming)/AMP-acid ligase II
VGIYGYNSLPWVEALLAICKVRAVPVNVNYRYVEEELRYLFGNADLKGLVYDEEFGPRISHVKASLPLLKTLVMIEDGSGAAQTDLDEVPFEEAIANGSPERDFPERHGDDQIIIYTGGTTGMPKGRHVAQRGHLLRPRRRHRPVHARAGGRRVRARQQGP